MQAEPVIGENLVYPGFSSDKIKYHIGINTENIMAGFMPDLARFGAVEMQKMAFDKIGFSDASFSRRVIMGYVSSANTVRIDDYNLAYYAKLNCNFVQEGDFDAVWTTLGSVPLLGYYSDCLQVILYDSSKDLAGVLHTSRHTLDSCIIQKFFSKISPYADPESIKAAFTPYLLPENHVLGSISALREKEWCHNGVIVPYGDGVAFDQGKAAKIDLIQCGVPEENIFDARLDTWKLSKIAYEEGRDVCSWRYWKHLNPGCGINEYNNMLENGTLFVNRAPSYFTIMLNKEEKQIKTKNTMISKLFSLFTG